jgi:hypothetical protein
MQSETPSTTVSAMGEIVRQVIETVADRPGDSPARRIARQQATACTMMAFGPANPVETMLAGQCVIFDHLLRDGAHDTLRDQPPEIKLRARAQTLVTGKMFLAQFAKFEEIQTRAAARLAAQTPVASSAPEAGAAAASVPTDDARQSARADPAEPAIGEGKANAPTAPRTHATAPAVKPPHPAPGDAPGKLQAGTKMLSGHPDAGTPVPPLQKPDRAEAGLQPTQTAGPGRQADTVARLAASLPLPASSRPGDRTVPGDQSTAAASAEMAEDLA